MAPDRLIETGIDRLLDLVVDRGELEVSEAAAELGAEEDTVVTWAESLEDAGIIDIHFSARRGRVLTPVEEDVSEEAVEQVREETADHVRELSSIEAAETELDRFADVLDRIEEGLSGSEADIAETRDRLSDADDLEEVADVLDSIEAAEADAESLEAHLEEAVAGLRVLEELERAQEDGTGEADEGDGGLLAGLRSLWPFGGDGEDGFTCSDCGAEFETEKGLETHRGMMHDD